MWALLVEQINVHNGRSITLLTVKDKEFIENVAKLSQITSLLGALIGSNKTVLRATQDG
jgi:hypothetical protein